ncbi:MAG TPA: hypothetical protein VNZ49_10150 [Bacteroidia bacterium]|nr:hypothetical protein [Bacteroidia bacterium]
MVHKRNVVIEITDIAGSLLIKEQQPVNGGLIELNFNLNNDVYLIKVGGVRMINATWKKSN